MKSKSLLFGLLCCLEYSTAVRIPVMRSRQQRTSKRSVGLARTNFLSKATSGAGEGDVSVSTKSDILYMANVTIGSDDFTLQLDTGSSDLWVGTTNTIAGSTASNLTLNLTYGIGYAAGTINQAPVSFAGFDIPLQAYLLADQFNNPVSAYGAVGILGLGFTSLSSIDFAVNKSKASWGRSFLYNAFASDTSTSNFITFALQRANDSADDVQGTFTIGEYVSGFETIQGMPQVSTFPVNNPSRWNVLLDGIYVGGSPVALNSSVPNVPSGKVAALCDSGTSYSYADPNVVQSMYGSISGAKLDTSSGLWTVPCDTEVDVTLIIGGNPYPLHPLDVVDYSITDSKTCIGTFVGQSLSVGGGSFDYLFGDNVLRSVYTMYDFGDFDSSGNMGNPYMKFLSITNATSASVDFHSLRGGTANTTISASGVNVNGTTVPTATSSSTGSLSTDSDAKLSKLLDYMPALLGVLAFNSLILLCIAGCGALYFMRARKGKGNRNAAAARDYQYQRVRSQYDPKDVPASPLPSTQNFASGGGPSSGMPPQPSRHGSSQSVHTLAGAQSQDQPFVPPAETEGDVTNVRLIHPEDALHDAPDAPNTPTSIVNSPNPYVRSGSASPGPRFMDPTAVAPIPRPRFVSNTTTASSDEYGRPQSLFSVASGPLLSGGNTSPRPASTYDIPMGSARPRFVSEVGQRPDSTFSSAPLVRRQTSESIDGDGINLMAPPRPRFMNDAPQPRPDSAASVGSLGGATPLRPQSRYMDVSGARPLSEA